MNRIKRVINSFLRYIRCCPKSIIKLVKDKKLWSKNETYFPYAKYHKSSFRIFFEQLLCVLRYGEVNDFYFLYGFDTKTNKECDEYIQHADFREKRNRKNNNPFNWTNVLRDKELFAIVGDTYEMPIIKTIGILKSSNLYFNDGKSSYDLTNYLSEHCNVHLFIKPLNDECGRGIFSIDVVNSKIFVNNKEVTLLSFKEYLCGLKDNEFIVQEKLIQHDEMNRLYDKSVNTIRIITIRDRKGNPFHFGSLLRIGANGSVVDNLAKGGVAVGINPQGTLKSFGFLKPPYGKIVNTHPDTNIQFEGFIIPYYKESIEMCINFHKKIKGVNAIGWDIAITKNGPVFIEGNDNFEISGIQACERGMKKEIYQIFA